MEKTWFVYLLECTDGTFYTGVTNDLEKRIDAHKSGKGSKYVSSRGFKQLLASKVCASRSDALKREYEIKQLSKQEKLDWFND